MVLVASPTPRLCPAADFVSFSCALCVASAAARFGLRSVARLPPLMRVSIPLSPRAPQHSPTCAHSIFPFDSLPPYPPPVSPRSLPPPFSMPQVFSDAAPFHSSFVVACSRSLCFATCSPTPSWVRSIQDAELYGIFHTLRQCSLQKLSHVCPLTDNMGVYYTVSSGRVSSACPARILRRIFRVCLQFQLCFQIAWVPSARNAADFFSRPLTCSPLCLSRAIHRLSPSSTLPVSTASSVWFRTPPFRFPPAPN